VRLERGEQTQGVIGGVWETISALAGVCNTRSARMMSPHPEVVMVEVESTKNEEQLSLY
jgi:hypothetical protein